MTPERVEVLNKMGFIWSGTTTNYKDGVLTIISAQQSKNQIWNDNFQQLQEYINTHGSTISLSSSTKLGVWAARQRREYQKKQLDEKANITKERVDLLNSIGFDWSPWDTKWQLRVNELLEYKRQHGDCLVSTVSARSKLQVQFLILISNTIPYRYRYINHTGTSAIRRKSTTRKMGKHTKKILQTPQRRKTITYIH